jgi:glycosyltransferase involved in cell wall biosynthesis
MKVLYFATYYARHYVRQDVIRRALRQIQDIEVVECVYNRRTIFRHFVALWKFIILSKRDIDVIIIGFRGHEIFPLIRLLTNKPIVFDAFISIYDTLCFDRKKYSSSSVIGGMAHWLDRYCCKKAEKVILDTNVHINYFSKTFKIPREKFSRVFVGADQKVFFPKNLETDSKKFEIFYYGTGLPLQGIDIILKAAKLLEHEPDIRFKIVGPIQKKLELLINQLDLNNVEFINWVPYKELSQEIAKADICLGGHFSSIDKAKRVISGKTFQFLAMKRPVIVGKNEATRELLRDKENCLMVNMGDAQDLARVIVELQTNNQLRNSIAEAGYQIYKFVQRDIKISLKKLLNLNYV